MQLGLFSETVAPRLTSTRLHNFLRETLQAAGYQLRRTIKLNVHPGQHFFNYCYPDIAVFFDPQQQKYLWLPLPITLYDDRKFLSGIQQEGNRHIKNVSVLLEAIDTMELHTNKADPCYIPCDLLIMPLCHEYRGHFLLCLVDNHKKAVVFFDPKSITSHAYRLFDLIKVNAIYEYYALKRGYTYHYDTSGQQLLLDNKLCGYYVANQILNTLGFACRLSDTVTHIKNMVTIGDWSHSDANICISISSLERKRLAFPDDKTLLVQWLRKFYPHVVSKPAENAVEILKKVPAEIQTQYEITIDSCLTMDSKGIKILSKYKQCDEETIRDRIKTLCFAFFNTHSCSSIPIEAVYYPALEDSLTKEFPVDKVPETEKLVFIETLATLISDLWYHTARAAFLRDLMKHFIAAKTLGGLRAQLKEFECSKTLKFVTQNILSGKNHLESYMAWLQGDIFHTKSAQVQARFTKEAIELCQSLCTDLLQQIDALECSAEGCLKSCGTLTPLSRHVDEEICCESTEFEDSVLLTIHRITETSLSGALEDLIHVSHNCR